MTKEKYGKEVVVAVSGGFDPIHIGHIRLFKEAKALGDKLVVIINNDNWIKFKKNNKPFMPEAERKEIIEAIQWVDEAVFTDHEPETEDYSVCSTLRKVNPDIFANGGDRFADNIAEAILCKEMGCQTVFNLGRGGKVQSSSWLLNDYGDE